ncbi:MAG: 1-acyl-sn-glycerol-3-phosphate acyltransferase [Rickettsiales bacterium]|nr:1-acyl-sn-glycerol-3-phosphate acyltransferase [Rickettsiales bacterium]
MKIRSILFYATLSLWTIFIGILMLPFAMLSKKYAVSTSYQWSKYTLFLCKHILGIDYKIDGVDKVSHESCIICSNHQSAWETIFFLYYFRNPIFILKKELFYLPIIGYYIKRLGMIFIDRDKPIESIKKIKKSIKNNNQKIVIFPEGTRIKYKNRGKFKSGVFFIAKTLKLPIIPNAHNAGKFWPKGMFGKKSGVITSRFLDPVNNFEDKNKLIKSLENNIYSSIL